MIALRNQAPRSYMTWLPVTLTWLLLTLTWLLYNLQLWRQGRWFRKFTVRFRPIKKEIASSMYNKRGCLAEDGKEMYKKLNARAQLLFCSLNLLFCGVLVAVVVAVCWGLVHFDISISRHKQKQYDVDNKHLLLGKFPTSYCVCSCRLMLMPVPKCEAALQVPNMSESTDRSTGQK